MENESWNAYHVGFNVDYSRPTSGINWAFLLQHLFKCFQHVKCTMIDIFWGAGQAVVPQDCRVLPRCKNWFPSTNLLTVVNNVIFVNLYLVKWRFVHCLQSCFITISKLVTPNSVPCDKIFYPTFTHMIHSYNLLSAILYLFWYRATGSI